MRWNRFVKKNPPRTDVNVPVVIATSGDTMMSKVNPSAIVGVSSSPGTVLERLKRRHWKCRIR